MARTIGHATYNEIVVDGKILEAVYRTQEARSKKKCSKKDCLVERDIMPYDRYVRVFFEDENKVEVFHRPCFKDEFGVSAINRR